MKNILTFLVISIAAHSFAQDNSETHSWGIKTEQQSTIGYYDRFGLPLSLHVTLTNAKHQFEFGPRYYVGHYSPGYKLGLGFQYKYYPNGYIQRFNTYFVSSLVYRQGLEERGAKKYDHINLVDITGDLDIRIKEMHLGAGYGVELKLSDKLYAASDARVIFGFGNRIFAEEYPSQPSFNNTITDFYLLLNWQFGVSLGYRF